MQNSIKNIKFPISSVLCFIVFPQSLGIFVCFLLISVQIIASFLTLEFGRNRIPIYFYPIIRILALFWVPFFVGDHAYIQILPVTPIL